MAFLDSLQPLRRRLPLLISLLLGVTIAVFTWAAYREMVQVLRAAGIQRATHAVGRLASTLELSARRLKGESRRVSSDTTVRAALLRTDSVTRNRAQRAFAQIIEQAPQVAALVVLDTSGTQVFGAGDLDDEMPPIENLTMDWDTVTDATRVDRMELGLDPPRYRVITRITDGDRPIGFFVQHRLLSTGQGFELLEGLIGEDATVLLGNASGDGWTNFISRVAGPSVDSQGITGVEYTDSEGEAQIGAVAPIPGTPWRAVVSEPEALVLGSARDHLRGMIPLALLVVAAGALGAWLISRSITRPLALVSGAADAMAKGDLSRRVPVGGNDELGILARSFNSMAEQVSGFTHELETRVDQRTAELREAQDTLVRRERLAILGQLAGSVGHELRNPLGVMTNAVFYLEAVLANEPGTVHEYLGILKTQIGLSEKIIADLLDYARIKPPQRDFVPLEELVDEQRRRLPPAERIEVVTDYQAGLPPAYVDRVQIGQVVLNLISNAMQAMPNGGTLTLRGAKNPADGVVLEVQDTGCGIPPENQEKVFEPLFTTKARGIGLGLAVSRGLAQANGGMLSLVSKIGRGSTFTLRLPIGPEAVE